MIPTWLPNAISMVRIALVPVWGLCAEVCRSAATAGDEDRAFTWRLIAVAVLVAIGVSDLVDGYLARRFGLTSRVGATLDAVADKLAQVGVVLFFTFRSAPVLPTIPLWFTCLILGRDVLLALGWLVVRKKRGGRVDVEHRFHGKLSSVLLFGLMILLTADLGRTWLPVLVWTIAALVVVSTADYARYGFIQLRQR